MFATVLSTDDGRGGMGCKEMSIERNPTHLAVPSLLKRHGYLRRGLYVPAGDGKSPAALPATLLRYLTCGVLVWLYILSKFSYIHTHITHFIWA